MQDVTCGIKTLMRPNELRRLLDSIYRFYPAMRCVVVDDSKTPSLDSNYPHWKHIKYIQLPFDTGLGAGRNVMIDAVDTKYCLYLDDDFVMCLASRIEHFKAVLDADIADIVGGQYREGGRFRKYHGLLEKRDKALIYRRADRGEGDVPVAGVEDIVLHYKRVDIVLNFFLGNTAVLRDVQWDAELKINTHTKFFWDAKQKNVRVVYCPSVHVQHKQTRSKEYAKLRNRKFYKRMLEKVGVTKLVKKGQWG